jgi:hypothetical protein
MSAPCTPQCAGRAAGNLLDQADDKLLSGRLLQHRARGYWQPYGLRRDDFGVPRFFQIAWQRSFDTAARIRVSRFETRVIGGAYVHRAGRRYSRQGKHPASSYVLLMRALWHTARSPISNASPWIWRDVITATNDDIKKRCNQMGRGLYTVRPDRRV